MVGICPFLSSGEKTHEKMTECIGNSCELYDTDEKQCSMKKGPSLAID